MFGLIQQYIALFTLRYGKGQLGAYLPSIVFTCAFRREISFEIISRVG